MTMFFPNQCYNKVCYKGPALYKDFLGSRGMNRVTSELCCYKGTILQRNYRKMTIIWSFSNNSFVKFHDKKGVCALRG